MTIELATPQEAPQETRRKVKGREGMTKKTVWLKTEHLAYLEAKSREEFRPLEYQLEMIVAEAFDRLIQEKSKPQQHQQAHAIR
jgi:hypothetical protein